MNTNRATESAYGWVIVVCAALAMVATLPGRSHGLGMIIERLLADPVFELTRTGYSYFNFWATLLGALFCFAAGTLIDRLGMRISVVVVVVGLATAVLAMTAVVSLPALFATLLIVRGLGQSALSVVSITMVGKWFDRHISLPMAVYTVLLSIGFIVVTLIAREYVGEPWRVLWSAIGISLLAFAAIAGLLVRDRPTREGSIAHASTVSVEQNDYTLAEALRTRLFWVCAAGISLFGMIVAGVSLFNESILADQGFSTKMYYDSLALGTGVSLLCNFLGGWLGRVMPVNRLLSVALLLLAGSLIWLTNLNSYPQLVGFVVVNAAAAGILTVLFFSAWPKLYGRTHLGKIQGTAQAMTVVASAIGPVLFAQSRQLTGSYNWALWLLAGCLVLIAAIAIATPATEKIIVSAG